MEKSHSIPPSVPARTIRSFLNSLASKKILAYLALISGMLSLALSGLFIHWAQAPGMVTSFYRMATAALALLPFVIHNSRANPFPRGKLLILPVLGGLFVALDHSFWSTSIGYTQIGTATLFNNIAPLWVALFAALFWREKLTGMFWLALGLTLAGVTIVFGNDLIARPQLGLGNLLAISSSFWYAAYYLVTQRARRFTSTLHYVWFVTATAAMFLFFGNLALGLPMYGYSSQTYLVFVGAGLISQIIGYYSIGYALGHLPASVVAPTMVSQPVLTTLLAIPLAGEMLLPGQWLGGLAVIVGIYLVNRARQENKVETA